MYESLTKYIPALSQDRIGIWVFPNTEDGIPDCWANEVPYIKYSTTFIEFIEDIYTFVETHEELELSTFEDILRDNGIDWSAVSLTNAPVEYLDARCILALLVAAVRLERSYEGVLLVFFEDGVILKWLRRIEEIDSGQTW